MKHNSPFRGAYWLAIVLFPCWLSAQNVGINDNNTAPDPNAMLDVQSATKGVLFPRMTTAQRTTLGAANPTEGMLVFDYEAGAYFFFVGGEWVQLTTGAGGGVPPGTILAFGGETPPDGYLACNGDALSKFDYPALFDAIGTAWGGDGLPNFRLPDLRGRFPRGWDDGAGNDPDAGGRTALHTGGAEGDNVGSYQGDQFSSHNHGGGDHRHGQPFSGYFYYRPNAGGWDVSSSNGEVHVSNYTSYSGTIINTEGGAETRPKNAYVQYIIKY